MRTLVWFRDRDLRVADHAALAAAAGGELLPVFLPGTLDNPHRRAFVAEAAAALAGALAAAGSGLVTAPGPVEAALPALAAAWGAERVLALRETDPAGRARDERLERVLGGLGIAFECLEGQTLLPPGALRNGQGQAYRVFTPFARAFFRQMRVDRPLPAPVRLAPLPGLLPAGAALHPGAAFGAARERLQRFLDGPARAYLPDRDRPDLPGTSRLSADLACGTLSVRTVWHAVAELGSDPALRTFLQQLLWREFGHQLLWERPELLGRPFRPGFEGFPWRRDPAAFGAWAEGRTGYPLVDAAARQLLATGFVHNRARMVAASFLAKDLLLPYRLGEAHYLAQLADADPACNNLGWQWSAGCGCDAQPWFRVFHPVTQGRRFDPQGDYVRQWLPELARLPARWIQSPWEAPAAVLVEAGVVLGREYPHPIVDHGQARQRFLAQAKAWLGRPGTAASRPECENT